MSIENLKTFDPFAEADEDTGETKQSQNYIHIRIQQRNGRKTLTTVQGLPKKFDQKKILKVIKKKFACNGTIVNDTEMGEVIQLQGDQRKDVQEFLVDKKEGLELDAKTIKNCQKHLGDSKPLLDLPFSSPEARALSPEQLTQKCQTAAKTPPDGWSSAQGAAGQEGKAPLGVKIQAYGSGGLEGAEYRFIVGG
ncbi:Eukaryotic translation initiation factor eIF-1 [Trapelia coarctata]|nr:Eukaryotic translation initiation factor eIF-1 [Trapelia coarctata]